MCRPARLWLKTKVRRNELPMAENQGQRKRASPAAAAPLALARLTRLSSVPNNEVLLSGAVLSSPSLHWRACCSSASDSSQRPPAPAVLNAGHCEPKGRRSLSHRRATSHNACVYTCRKAGLRRHLCSRWSWPTQRKEMTTFIAMETELILLASESRFSQFLCYRH